MTGRRPLDTGAASWTVPKLKAELNRRGIAINSWDKKSTLLRRLREDDNTNMSTRALAVTTRRGRPGRVRFGSDQLSGTTETSEPPDAVSSDTGEGMAQLRQEMANLQQQMGAISGNRCRQFRLPVPAKTPRTPVMVMTDVTGPFLARPHTPSQRILRARCRSGIPT